MQWDEMWVDHNLDNDTILKEDKDPVPVEEFVSWNPQRNEYHLTDGSQRLPYICEYICKLNLQNVLACP